MKFSCHSNLSPQVIFNPRKNKKIIPNIYCIMNNITYLCNERLNLYIMTGGYSIRKDKTDNDLIITTVKEDGVITSTHVEVKSKQNITSNN